jgi:hypothetical protein
VFFGFLSLCALVGVIGLVMALASGGSVSFIVADILAVLAWCAGLVSVIGIWRPESGRYYAAAKAARMSPG